VLPRNHPDLLSEAHTRHLDSLELRLRCMQQHSQTPILNYREERRTERVAELYRLAGQVYLHRAARRTRVGFPPTKILIQEAFKILGLLDSCEGLWPLFILGMEAKSDEQRMIILEVYSRLLHTGDKGNVRSIKKMVEASWIQDDLSDEEEVDYSSKISALMSAHRALPTFV